MNARILFGRLVVVFSLVLLLSGGIATAMPLDPFGFASLGSLPSGDILFDTDALTFNGTAGGVVQSQAGGPDVAVFAFDAGSLTAGDTITGVGSRPLVLLFQGNFTIAGTIDISGQTGGVSALLDVLGRRSGGPGGAGGPGGGGGGAGAGYTVSGGVVSCCINSSQAGDGPGAGGGGVNTGGSADSGGGGAGFGSAGRVGIADDAVGGAAGAVYGDLLVALEGGSGGGGGGSRCCVGLANAPGRGGGGGGGGIEIGAIGLLEFLGGSILANGGSDAADGIGEPGGGGSGGGILLHAFDISLDMASILQAVGGRGSGNGLAGCGGGGRIALITNSAGALTDAGATINASGGLGCNVAGPVTTATDPNVGVAALVVAAPEPATLAIFAFGLAGLGFMRRRCRAGPVSGERAASVTLDWFDVTWLGPPPSGDFLFDADALTVKQASTLASALWTLDRMINGDGASNSWLRSGVWLARK